MASIIVVGAGLSGLTCAWRLQRAGHDVEVLEREDGVGGRARERRRQTAKGEFVVAAGCRTLRPADKNLHALLAALDLSSAVRPLAQADIAVFTGEGQVAALEGEGALASLRTPALGSRGRLGLARLALERARQRKLLDPWRPELAAPFDRQNLASYLLRTAGREATERQLAPALELELASQLEHSSNALGLLWLERRSRGARLEGLDGGLGGLADCLANQLRLRRSTQVMRVESESGGVRVRYRAAGRDGLAIADLAVLAVPGSQVPPLCPKLVPGERVFFDGVRYARGVEVSLLLEEVRELGAYGTAFAAGTGGVLAGVYADHLLPNAAPPGAGLLRAVLREVEAQRCWDGRDADIAQKALESLASAGFGRLAPLAQRVHRIPFASPQFRPGYLSQLAAFLGRVERTPRLVFAGDYTVGPHSEGAVTSGLRAASEVARLLSDRPASAQPSLQPLPATATP